MKKKESAPPINSVFFGLFLLVLAGIHLLHVSLIAEPSFKTKGYFLYQALLQIVIEIGVLSLLLGWMRKSFPNWAQKIAVITVFFLFLAQIIDFPLVRIMDMPIWFVFHFIVDETLQNFFEMLYASNVTLISWFMGIGLFILLMVCALYLYSRSEKLSRKLRLNRFSIASACCASLALLYAGDLAFGHRITSDAYLKFCSALPWKKTICRTDVLLEESICFPFHRVPTQNSVEKMLEGYDERMAKKPDIFLFIIESLREDYINQLTASALTKFKDDNLSTPFSLSSSNATQLSWFSIFHSKWPFFFGNFKPQKWASGSIPLQIFKKMGYGIHLYTSARLQYYQMDEILLGKNRVLAETYQEFYEHDLEPSDSDRLALDKLVSDLKNSPELGGRLFIIFLDSTHFDYSWPKPQMTLFHPCEKINYMSAIWSDESAEAIKNRYRNSLHYIDVLMGNFFNDLKKQGAWEKSLIVITGDHGEEFYEQGHLFHASNLSLEQLRVPIYYKFPEGSFSVEDKPCHNSSHIDIFPTLLQFTSGIKPPSHLIEGESIFTKLPEGTLLSARYNASRPPYEFILHNSKYKLTARFDNMRNIMYSRKLQLVSLKDSEDKELPLSLELVEREFGPTMKRMFLTDKNLSQ